MEDTLALILAGGRGTRLDLLSGHRAKPSVPFAGKFRLIDFVLSNCVNSGIYNVGVITQYLPMSLKKHIGIGKPWDLDRAHDGITILQPYTGEPNHSGWYEGTAHAVYRNLNFIKNKDPDQVLILSGDHVYEMDYSKMIDFHRSKDADLTVAAQPVEYEEASRFGILDHNQEMQITDFVEKPEQPPSNLASMGIYTFETDKLITTLEQHCSQDNSDFGHHILPPLIENGATYAYEFKSYWRDVGTLKSFWQTNLELTNPSPGLNLHNNSWEIHTRSQKQPPAKYGINKHTSDSLISNGAIINGKVENCVISPGVYIAGGAVVKDSIVFDDTVIKENSQIEKSIIDKEVEIQANCSIGSGKNLTPNESKPELLTDGLNIIAKRATIPAETTIQRNCRIFSCASEEDFDQKIVPSGSTVACQTGIKIAKGNKHKVKQLNR